MTRALVCSALILSAVATAGCTWRFDRPMQEETTSAGTLDRAEAARQRDGRMHPDCRDSRADRDDQPERCETVVRRR